MSDDFDSALDETLWEFPPHGSLQPDVCGNPDGALYWAGSPADEHGSGYVTTRQLIVDKNYMVQFKVSKHSKENMLT